jgi:hypothetical protein
MDIIKSDWCIYLCRTPRPFIYIKNKYKERQLSQNRLLSAAFLNHCVECEPSEFERISIGDRRCWSSTGTRLSTTLLSDGPIEIDNGRPLVAAREEDRSCLTQTFIHMHVPIVAHSPLQT